MQQICYTAARCSAVVSLTSSHLDPQYSLKLSENVEIRQYS